jgi:hypothetical protein
LFAKVCFNTDFALDIVPKVWYTVVVPKLLGGKIMTQKWSFQEDYIVCKFCKENEGQDIVDVLLDQLVIRLEDSGFKPRSKTAVQARARVYTYLLRGWEISNPSRQAQYVYDAVINTMDEETRRWIKHYVDEVYCSSSLIDEGASWFNNSKVDQNHYLDIEVPNKGESFYDVFHELLERCYAKRLTDKKTLGQVKKEFRYDLLYLYGINGNTFDAIKREKYDTVSRTIIFKLCFALELDYIDAKRLMESVGYDFRRNIKAEVVIEAILKCDSPRRFIVSEVDETLYEHAKVTLFS